MGAASHGNRHVGPSYSLSVASAYSLPMYVCSVAPGASGDSFPLVRELEIANATSRAIEAHVLTLRVSGRSIGDWIYVPPIGPGQTRPLEKGHGASETLQTLLQEQTVPAVAKVQLLRDAECVAEAATLLLPPRSWLNERAHRRLVATFVTPDELEIVDLVAEALGDLQSGELPTGSQQQPEPVRQALAQLYSHIRSRFNLRYREPQPQRDPRTGTLYQRVGEPQELLAPGLAVGATCLDLSILFASCIEHLNSCLTTTRVSPWIIFTGSPQTASAHAFVGCRIGGAGPLDVIENPARVRRDLESGRLIVFEATGVCQESRMSLSFQDAVRSAVETIATCPVHAVDVAACRIGHGSAVPSLPEAPQPIVTRAFSQARKLQGEYGLPNVDSTLVLFALSFEAGTILEQLLASVGATCEQLRRVLFESLNTTTATVRAGSGTPTRNCRRLWENSFEVARTMGRRNPRECDLLWALAWSRSRRLRQMLASVGLPPIEYETQLARLCPEPPASETTQM